jgi:hypothetical protein
LFLLADAQALGFPAKKEDAVDQNKQPADQTPSQPAVPSATPSSTPPAQQYVNVWKPVTDLYVEEHANLPPPVIAAPPPSPVTRVSPPQRSYWEGVPMSLHVLTGFYFLNALAYLVIGGRLIMAPAGDFSRFIAFNSRLFLLFAVSQRKPEEFVTLVGQAMLFSAAISTVVGVMWLLRSWKIRWITMAYALGRALRVGVYYFAGAVSGVGSGIPAELQTLVMFGVCINLLIFCYLAFYPGVEQAFEKKF